MTSSTPAVLQINTSHLDVRHLVADLAALTEPVGIGRTEAAMLADVDRTLQTAGPLTDEQLASRWDPTLDAVHSVVYTHPVAPDTINLAG